MAYKVFISHSTRDQGLVVALANLLSEFGIERDLTLLYAQKFNESGFNLLKSS